MARLTRDANKSNFRTGFKPTEQNFIDVEDSKINIKDDHIEPVVVGGETYIRIGFDTGIVPVPNATPPRARLEVNGGIKLGGERAPMAGGGAGLAGTLVYEGGQLYLHDGLAFGQVGGGGGGGGIWTEPAGGIARYQPFADAGIEIRVTDATNNVDFNATAPNAPLSFSTNGIPRIQVTNLGQVQISSLVVNTRLQLPNGEVIQPSTGPTINSDFRLKQNIRPFTDGLALLKNVNPVHFQFKEGVSNGPVDNRIGVIAQDLRTIFPYLVKEQPNHYDQVPTEDGKILTVDAASLTYILINAIKDLSAQVETLQARVEAIEKYSESV